MSGLSSASLHAFALAGLFGVAAIIGGHFNAFMTGLLGLAGALVYTKAEKTASK